MNSCSTRSMAKQIESFKFESYDHDIDLSKTVILYGSGISISGPTHLPTGQDLLNFYMNRYLGEEARLCALEAWEYVSDCINKEFGVCVPSVRLEFIIDMINQAELEFLKKSDSLAGIGHFLDAESNSNHQMVYKIAQNFGAKLVTPNFDCCVEKCGVEPYSAVYEPSSKTLVGGIEIIHYHGIASKDPDYYSKLGATLKGIKFGLPEEIMNTLDDWFYSGYNLICIGFSCSDFFDMTPYFSVGNSEEFSGSAIFFQHGDNVPDDVKNRVESFFHRFKDKAMLTGNTTKYLHKLSGVNCDSNTSNSDYHWKDGYSPVSDDIRDYCTIKIFSRLGIGLCSCNVPWRNFSDRKEMIQYYICKFAEIGSGDYLKKNFNKDQRQSVMYDFYDIINWDRRKTMQTRLFSKNVRKARCSNNRMTQESISKSITLTELMNSIESNEVLGNDNESAYIYALNRMAKEQIRNQILTGRSYSWETILRCARALLEVHYGKYLYMSYYLSILRTKIALESVFVLKLPDEEDVRKMMTIAMEFCSIEELIKNIECLSYSYLALGTKCKSCENYKKSIKYRLFAGKIAKKMKRGTSLDGVEKKMALIKLSPRRASLFILAR